MALKGMSLNDFLAAAGLPGLEFNLWHSVDSNLRSDLQCCHCTSSCFTDYSRWFIALLLFVFSTFFLPLRVHQLEWATGRSEIYWFHLSPFMLSKHSSYNISFFLQTVAVITFFLPSDFSSILRISRAPAIVVSDFLWIPSEAIFLKLFI